MKKFAPLIDPNVRLMIPKQALYYMWILTISINIFALFLFKKEAETLVT